MRYYQDKYTLPLWNWLMIQAKGYDLSYLLKKGKIKNDKQHQKLNEVFENILSSLNFIDNDVYLQSVRWKSQLTQMRLKIIGRTKEGLHRLERIFRDYLEALQKTYKSFKLTEYYFNPDWRRKMQMFKEHLPEHTYRNSLKLLKDFEDIGFFTWSQYTLLINQEKYLPLLGFTLNPQWKDMFILSRTIETDNLIKIDNHLLQIFEDNQMYEEYQIIRNRLFNLSNLNGVPKEDVDPFKGIAYLEEIVGSIDTKRTSLAKYEGYIERATRKIEQSKPGKGGSN
jgi:hypothetical protein